MTRFIKIFAILTGLTLITACAAATALLDEARDAIAEERLARAEQLIREQALENRIIDARLEALNLPEEEQVAARARIAQEVKDYSQEVRNREVARLGIANIDGLELTEEEQVAINREVEYQTDIEGLTPTEITVKTRQCRAASTSAGCSGIVARLCYNDPFDDACDDSYQPKRATYINECGIGSNIACLDTVSKICRDDPEITGCADYVDRICDNNSFDRVCENVSTSFCSPERGGDLFSPLCLTDERTDLDRLPTCLSEKLTMGTFTTRCEETVKRICDDDPLLLLCDGVPEYFDAQRAACSSYDTGRFLHPDCQVGNTGQLLITACLATPFHATCVDSTNNQGGLFAPHLEAAQKAYCEGGATTVAEIADQRNNCTNTGSSPPYASLARNITKDGIRTFHASREDGDGNPEVTANAVTTDNPNVGGFLRTGAFGSRLGIHTGVQASVGSPATYDRNTGNFDRETNEGGAWIGLPDGYRADSARIWDVASTIDANDGFTYFLAENGGNFLSYAGIWRATNFGAPLAAPVGNAPTSAIWSGHFTAFSGEIRLNAAPTDFYVDFTDGTFNIHNSTAEADPTTGTAEAESRFGSGEQSYASDTFVYTVNGVFGASVTDPNNPSRTLNAGELSGKVNLVNDTFASKAESDGNTPTTTKTFDMPLTGLIGEEGALGIFLDPSPDGSPNVGGFTAAPTPAN